MQRIVINRCYGGFGLSREAFLRLRELGNKTALEEPDIGESWPNCPNEVREAYLSSFCSDIKRNDKDLVKVVDELGVKASGPHASVAVVEIPDGVEWTIHEYDGNEHIAEVHRTWY